MKVRVAVKGRFHAFDLARELQRHGALAGILSTYPRSETRRFGLADGLVTTRPAQELARRAWSRLPRALRTDAAVVRAYRRFDRATAAWLRDDADVFVGWSGASLEAFARAESLGLATVCERGSTHAAWARERLLAVHEAAGVPPRVAPVELVEREVREYAAAHRVVVPSGFVERTFLERGVPAEKLARVPYGVDLAAFEAPAGPAPDGVFRVLFVGAVSVRKGVLTLLDAFARLGGRRELVLVGRVQPELAPRLRSAPANVRVVGTVPQAELRAHYATASVFCLPSHEEGLAMVVPQAMAAGRAVVASHASGAGDLIEDGEHGLLLDDGDVEGLAARLEALQREPERAVHLGRRAAARVARGSTWADYGERVLAVYRELLAERASRGADA